MKSKLIWIINLILIVFGFSVYSQSTSIIDDPEFDIALSWMYEHGLTKYNDSKTYWPQAELTRQEAAKFFTEFASKIVDKDFDDTGTCAFSDIKDSDPTLKEYILESCTMGLFKGVNGKFYPFAKLTKAEAITVLIRSIHGKQDENIQPWYLNYYEKALEIGITKDTDLSAFDRLITRYEIALMLYRAGEFNLIDNDLGGDIDTDMTDKIDDNPDLNNDLDFLSGFDY